MEVKKQRRFDKMRDHVVKNPMMVVPRKQLPEVSGTFKSENCAFDMFLRPVRPTPNFKPRNG